MEYFIIVFVLFFLMIIPWRMRQRRIAAVRHILDKKKYRLKPKEYFSMKELAKQFIGKECIVYTVTSTDSNIQGVIKEIDDGGMVVEKKSGELEIINLDFVTRIREYPRNKNGKKKIIFG